MFSDRFATSTQKLVEVLDRQQQALLYPDCGRPTELGLRQRNVGPALLRIVVRKRQMTIRDLEPVS